MTLTVQDTSTYLTLPVNVIFQQTFLRNAMPRCPYFLGTVQGDVAKNRGTATASFRRIENVTPNVTALTQVSTASYMQGRTPNTLSLTNKTATVAKYGDFLILNEEAEVLQFNTQMDKIMQVMGIAYGRAANQLQRNIAEDNLTLVYADGAANDAATATKINIGAIRKVINTLDKNSALTFAPMSTSSTNEGSTPILPAYIGLCHPDVAVDVALISGFKGVETYASHTSTYPGEFGMLSIAGRGVRFVSSEDATVDADSGSGTITGVNGTSAVDLYTTCIYGQDCLGSVGLGTMWPDGSYRAGDTLGPVELIVKALGSGGTGDPLNEISTIGYKFWHTGLVLNANWGRGIRSGATALS